MASSYFVDVPLWLFGAALLCGLLGVVALGLLTYRQARATGSGFWRSLGRALRRMLGGALDLFV